MKKDIEQLYEKFIARKAKRLGLPADQARRVKGEEPQFWKAAKRRADQLGITLDEVLARDIKAMDDSPYPGPDCLLPNEIEDLILGIVSSSRAAHLDSCDGCKQLLLAVKARPAMSEDILKEIESIRLRSPSSRAVSPRWEFVSDLLSILVVFVLVAATLYQMFRFFDVRTAYLVAFGLALICLIFSFVNRWYQASDSGNWVLRHSLGAVVGAVVVAIFVTKYTAHNSTISLQDRLQNLAALSIKNRLLTGSFLEADDFSGLITVKTRNVLLAGATYSAESKGVPGRMIAEVSAGTGNLWWEHAGTRDLRSKFTVGTIKEVSKDTFLLQEDNGERIRLRKGESEPEIATRVVVAFDPKTLTAQTIVPLRRK